MKSVARIMVLVAATFWWQGEARSDQDHALEQPIQLFFIFSEWESEHAERVDSLREIARLWAGHVELIGIVRTAGDRPGDGVAEATGLDKIIDVDTVRKDPDVPDALVELSDAHDYLYFEELPSPVSVDDHQVMVEFVSELMSGHHPTDIQENTWGKIKVFFN